MRSSVLSPSIVIRRVAFRKMRWTFDSREVRPGMGFIALKGEKSDGRAFIPAAKAAGAVDIIEGLEELHERARARRRELSATVVGVTGSAGKTTTKELLKTFLAVAGKTYGTEGNFNNHIGLPLTILNCPDDADFLVLEMGSNHPGEIASLCEIAEPDIGVVTGIGSAHLEFFGSRAGIAEEKGALLASARDFGVYPDWDDFAAELGKRGGDSIGVSAERSPLKESEEVLPPHFADNAALAFAVASRFGVSQEAARHSLAGFALPGARWRRVEKNGVAYIDDTYNANPDSMIGALDVLSSMQVEGRRIAVLGDMFELGEGAFELHKKVFDHARSLKLDRIIGVGEMSAQCDCDRAFGTLAEFKAVAVEEIRAGDTVLLKASHGMKLGELLV